MMRTCRVVRHLRP